MADDVAAVGGAPAAGSRDTPHAVIVEASTHDDLKAGRVCVRRSFWYLLAPTWQDAQLAAAQCVAQQGWMPTRTTRP